MRMYTEVDGNVKCGDVREKSQGVDKTDRMQERNANTKSTEYW